MARNASPFAGLTPAQARAKAAELAAQRDHALRDDLHDAFAPHSAKHILILSGGDAHGAFGCGVLAGWRESADQPRPTFDIVTGVSTGALMATFAFLGEPQDDAVLRDVYLKVRDADIFSGPLDFGSPDAVFDTAPLRRLIARHVTRETLVRIAAAHHEGRRLYVATVELDTGAVCIWPMSKLAADAMSGSKTAREEGLPRFRQILLAAASIPVLFPPVEIDGGLHADAGLREAIVLRASMLGSGNDNDTSHDAPTVWAIFNGPLGSTPDAVDRDVLHIGARSLVIYSQALEELSLRNAAHLAASRKPAATFRWISQPVEDDAGRERVSADAPGLLGPMFDPATSRRWYDAGVEFGRSSSWNDGPPRMDGDAPEASIHGR